MRNYGMIQFKSDIKGRNTSSLNRSQSKYNMAVKSFQDWKKKNSSEKKATCTNTPQMVYDDSARSSANQIYSELDQNERMYVFGSDI